MCKCPLWYETALTATVSSLPLQALAVGEGDEVRIGIHTALGAATPHALHGLAGAVGAAGSQAQGILHGRTLRFGLTEGRKCSSNYCNDL